MVPWTPTTFSRCHWGFFTAPSPGSIWTVFDFNIGCLLQCYCCVFWDCKKVCIVFIAIFAIATMLKRLFYVEWDDPSIFTKHTFPSPNQHENTHAFYTNLPSDETSAHVFPFQDLFLLLTSRQICWAKIFAQIDVPMKVSANGRESVSYQWNLWKGELEYPEKFMGFLSQLGCLVLLLSPCVGLNFSWSRYVYAILVGFQAEIPFPMQSTVDLYLWETVDTTARFSFQNIFEAKFCRLIYPQISLLWNIISSISFITMGWVASVDPWASNDSLLGTLRRHRQQLLPKAAAVMQCSFILAATSAKFDLRAYMVRFESTT